MLFNSQTNQNINEIIKDNFSVRTLPEQYLRTLKKNSEPANFRSKILKSVLIVIIVVGLMGLAAWLFLKSVKNQKVANNSNSVVSSVNQNSSNSSVNNFNTLAGNLNTVANQNTNSVVVDVNNNSNQNLNDNVNINSNINNNVNQNSNINSNQSAPTVKSKDSDNDGLTDIEELLWSTDGLKTDSDDDGYQDKEELMNFYNPNQGNGAKLKESSLVKSYTNERYGYTLLLPKDWRIEFSDPLSVMFIADNDEFVQVIIQDNLTGMLTARDWYLNENPAVLPSSLDDVIIGGMAGVTSADGLNVYILNGNYIYTISYNIGLKQTADFQSTYQLILKSFQLFSNPLDDLDDEY